uniref:Retrotransposon gag domain-containing protein n=1 Tax=Tanacetum cinerariifolium TaxID=118510 RepID=A0A6L2MKJ0_TANCI|nr:hypothetical protein [Tanacetum cinerariifolium]
MTTPSAVRIMKTRTNTLRKFLRFFDLFHIPNITQDQVMLRAFHMSLTGAANHWVRNKLFGSITTWEDLKIKFLSKYCPPACTAKKMEEINNFQQESNETLYQARERYKELLMKCPQHYLTEMQEVILFYNGLDVQTRQILDSKAIQAQLNNIEREIKKVNEKVYATQVGCKQCKRPHYTKDCPLKEEGASISVMPLSTYLNLGLGELAHTKLTVELAYRTMKYPRGIAKNVLVGIGKFGFSVDFIILDIPEDVKLPLILGRPFLCTAHAKIDVFKKKIALRVGDEKIIFKSVKHVSSLIKRLYMLSLKERMKLDLEARLMRKTLVLNISLYPLYGGFIKLNDLNVTLELRRDQVDNLMPTIKEVVENIDSYRDQDTRDIILGEPFYKASCMEERRFDGLMTIYNGSDNVTYQMNLVSVPKAQKFLQGVLNLGPEYDRDAKMEEWLTRGHISDLAAKKSIKLAKYRSSGLQYAIVVMLEYRRIRKEYRPSLKNDMPPRDK